MEAARRIAAEQRARQLLERQNLPEALQSRVLAEGLILGLDKEDLLILRKDLVASKTYREKNGMLCEELTFANGATVVIAVEQGIIVGCNSGR